MFQLPVTSKLHFTEIPVVSPVSLGQEFGDGEFLTRHLHVDGACGGGKWLMCPFYLGKAWRSVDWAKGHEKAHYPFLLSAQRLFAETCVRIAVQPQIRGEPHGMGLFA